MHPPSSASSSSRSRSGTSSSHQTSSAPSVNTTTPSKHLLAPTPAPIPPLLPSSAPMMDPSISDAANTEDPQAVFRVAANALAQLYRTATQAGGGRAQRDAGYQAALADIMAGLASLRDHPLAVQSNGRCFIPLDLATHLVAAAGVAHKEQTASTAASTETVSLPWITDPGSNEPLRKRPRDF